MDTDFETRLVEACRATLTVAEDSEHAARRFNNVRKLLAKYPPPPEPGVYLLVSATARPPYWFLVKGQRAVIGRGPEADLVLDHPQVSVRHCLIESDGLDWQVTDLESKNGVFVNGVKCDRAFLRRGDLLKVGKCGLLFIPITADDEV